MNVFIFFFFICLSIFFVCCFKCEINFWYVVSHLFFSLRTLAKYSHWMCYIYIFSLCQGSLSNFSYIFANIKIAFFFLGVSAKPMSKLCYFYTWHRHQYIDVMSSNLLAAIVFAWNIENYGKQFCRLFQNKNNIGWSAIFALYGVFLENILHSNRCSIILDQFNFVWLKIYFIFLGKTTFDEIWAHIINCHSPTVYIDKVEKLEKNEFIILKKNTPYLAHS